MTCCPTYLWISPCEKPPRYLVKPIYATSSLKWKIPFKKNSVTVHRPYFITPFPLPGSSPDKGAPVAEGACLWVFPEQNLAFKTATFHGSFMGWRTTPQESDGRSGGWEGRTAGEKWAVLALCWTKQCLAPPSTYHPRREEDMSFESTEGKNSSATI